MKGSSTLIAAQAANDMRARGIDVIDLSVGEPDFDTPQFIKDLAWDGLEKGLTKYTSTSGLAEFRSSIADFYAHRFGTSFGADEVAATCGGKQGLFNAACSLLNPGDDVLIPKPYWVTFPAIATFCGANSIFIDTAPTGFILTADEVKAAITPRTKLLIINSPNNPTGRVVPPEEMRRIVEICAERDVYVLTDECYLFFAYPPAEPFTSASLPDELRQYVCVGGSFSKTYAMTGWRIGYTVANLEWTKAMVKLQSHSATHPTSFVQYACAKAVQDAKKTIAAVNSMTGEYERRRDWLVPALNEVEGFKCEMPEGAFYAFVDVREMIGERFGSSADIADALLRDANIVVTDGEGFGADGYLRISYATSMETLHRAVDKMRSLAQRPPPRLITHQIQFYAVWSPPVIIRPISSTEVTFGSTSPTILPSRMTSKRSARAVTSSSSAETSSTAEPASRSSISLRWMNSMAPISTPRVGCETSSSFGFNSNSRPMMSFCWLPPDKDFAGSAGFGGRTSNRSMISPTRLSIAELFINPVAAAIGGR